VLLTNGFSQIITAAIVQLYRDANGGIQKKYFLGSVQLIKLKLEVELLTKKTSVQH
jgi:hypothetical protein